MIERTFRLLAAAGFAVVASLLSVSSASACYSGCGFAYAAPVAPVLYAMTPVVPVVYAAPVASCDNPCGYGGWGGQSYGALAAPAYGYGVASSYVGAGYGYSGYGYRAGYGYRGGSYGYRTRVAYRGGYGFRGGYRSSWSYRAGGAGHVGRWR